MNKIQFTKFRSVSPLTKAISLVNGKIKKEAQILSNGTAERIETSFEEFYDNLINTDSYTAFGYGTSDYDKIGIVSSKSGKADNKHFITRQKKNFNFPEGPGILMLDYDYSEQCPFKDEITFKKFLTILEDIIPDFDKCAKIVRESVSAGVYQEGKKKKNYQKGFHVYIPVLNAKDIERFGKLLNDYLWAEGYGYIKIAKDGSILKRSLIDVAVLSPERIEYIGEPTVFAPLLYEKPKHKYYEGLFLNTKKLKAKNLNRDAIRKKYNNEVKRTKKLRAEIITKYDHKRVLNLVDEGYTAREAEEIVRFNREHDNLILDTREILYFDNGEQCTIEEAIKKNLFGEYCACPIKGLKSGRQKAKFRNKNGRPEVYSYATGKTLHIKKEKKKSINIVDAKPGSGKSFGLLKNIVSGYREGKYYCIVLPTFNLINEYCFNLKKRIDYFGNIREINSKNQYYVVQQVALALKDEAQILLITQACLKQLDKSIVKRMTHFHLIMDESFEPMLNCEQYKLQHCVSDDGILKTLCDWEPLQWRKDAYYLVLKKSATKECNLQIKKTDELKSIENSATNELLKVLKDDTKTVILTKMNTSNDYCIGVWYNCKNLEYFKTVTFASAFIKYTSLYHWLDYYFNMKDVTSRYQDEFKSLSHRAKKLILYPLLDHYTKFVRNNIIIQSKKTGRFYDVQQLVNTIINKHSGFDDNTLRVLNNDDYFQEINLLKSGKAIKGKRISSYSHGLNKYKHVNSAVIVAAFNLRNHQVGHLKKIIPDFDPWIGYNVLTIIQCFMRTSLRDSDSEASVHVIVPDKRTACKVQEFFHDLPKIKNLNIQRFFEIKAN